ncbi:nineteen complex-related protein 2-domain-containing protein [Flammula alnicola]|nr:nineteen complex-related protein 2-domain-containing protein [Flammula alnicola]
MASTPPVIFRRNKAKPTPRARQTSPEKDGDAQTSETAKDSPSTLATKLKHKIKKAKPKSRLSFGGDEEEEGDGEVFKVKKSNLSQKMALGTHPAIIPRNLDQATISSNESPKYDAAYIEQLKASTPTVRPPPPSDVGSYDADMSMDFGDVSMQSIDMDIEETTSFISSESSIQVAKEKRERIRKFQVAGEDDFISLSVARRDEVQQGPHPESRLMREEDELGEGDDEFAEYTSAQERIALGKKSRKIEATQRRDAMKELIADAEEEDEETIEWEQEQLRRGGHRTPEPSSPTTVKQVYKAAPIPPATPVPTLGPAISRLSEQLAQLTASHARNSATLTSLAQERSEVDDREKEMREMVEKAEAKRAWFGSFKEWTESVAGFLDEKYPLLEKLEEEHLSLLKERSAMITKRRTEDDEDDLATFLGPLPASAPLELEEMDELGRTIPKSNPADARRQRRVARVARRQLRSSRPARPPGEEEEGYSTDSSLAPPDALAYTDAMKSLALRTKEVLADVKAEEFRDPGKGRWSIWREKYPDSYVGAWGGLGLVSVWEFWVRLESVGWDCIENPRSLHSFKWYKGLYEYCRPGEGQVVEERELGSDGDLVASMISTAVIPMICKILDNGALDVHSKSDIRRMIDLAEELKLVLSLGVESSRSLLLKSVMNAFQSAISASESSTAKYMSGYRSRARFDPEAIPARRRFLNRHVKLLKNLLSWRKYTGERFGLGILIGKLVEGCIITVAESGWEVGGEDTARKVVNMLPEELIPHSVEISEVLDECDITVQGLWAMIA